MGRPRLIAAWRSGRSLDRDILVRCKHDRADQAIGLHEPSLCDSLVELRKPVIQGGSNAHGDGVASRRQELPDLGLGAELIDGDRLAVHSQRE